MPSLQAFAALSFSLAPAMTDHGGDWRRGNGATCSAATGSANWRKVKRKSGEGRRQASKDEKEGAGRCWDRSGLPRAYVCVFLASPRCCYMVGRPSASLCHLRKSGMQRAGVLNYLITYKDIGVLITYKKIVDRECRRGKEEPMINP